MVVVSFENDPKRLLRFFFSFQHRNQSLVLQRCKCSNSLWPLEGIIQSLTDQPGSTLLILCRLPERPAQSWSRRSVPLDDDLWVFVAVGGAWNKTPD